MTKLGKEICSNQATESLKQSEMNTFLNAKSEILSDQGSQNHKQKVTDKVILNNNLELFSKQDSNQTNPNNFTLRSPFNGYESNTNDHHVQSLNNDLDKIGDIEFVIPENK